MILRYVDYEDVDPDRQGSKKVTIHSQSYDNDPLPT